MPKLKFNFDDIEEINKVGDLEISVDLYDKNTTKQFKIIHNIDKETVTFLHYGVSITVSIALLEKTLEWCKQNQNVLKSN